MPAQRGQGTARVHDYYAAHPDKEMSIYHVAEALRVEHTAVSQALASLRRVPSHLHKVDGHRGLYVWKASLAEPSYAKRAKKRVPDVVMAKGDDFLATILKVQADGCLLVSATDDEFYIVKKLEI